MLIFLTPSRTGLSNKRNMAVGTKTINALVPLRHGTLITPPVADEMRATSKVWRTNSLHLNVFTTPKSHCIT